MRGRARGERLDAVVVGAGPNGLSAALALAERGRSVLLLEQASTPGGGLRSEELVEPGFRHDLCASVLAFLPMSPSLRRHAAALVVPPRPLAHPFDDGTAALVERDVEATARRLGGDEGQYRRLIGPLVAGSEALFADVLENLPPLPRHPGVTVRMTPGLLPALHLARSWFAGRDARALIAGAAAHSMLPLGRPLTGGFAMLMLTAAHAGGWPFARGGSGALASRLVDDLRAAGGEVRCGVTVRHLDQLPASRVVLLDVAPPAVATIAGDHLAPGFARRLRDYPYGPGACKVDWTLDGPIPWRATGCATAGTVHVGGDADEIVESERAVARGLHPDRPFVLVTQPSLFDSTRAPAGGHVAWGYCHVPSHSAVDVSEGIERQVERFAPGFRGRIRARHVLTAQDLERREPNCVGGDLGAGRFGIRRLLGPGLRPGPYATTLPGLFLCSAATPPGPGIHGMSGRRAADAAEGFLRRSEAAR